MKSIDQEKAQMYLKKKMTLQKFKIRIFSLGPKIQFGFIRVRVAFLNKSGPELRMKSKQSKRNNNQHFIHRIKMAAIICVGVCMFIQDVKSYKF